MNKILAAEIPAVSAQVRDLDDALSAMNQITIDGVADPDLQKAASDVADAKNDANLYFSLEPARSEVQNELTACQNKCNSMPKPSNPTLPLIPIAPPFWPFIPVAVIIMFYFKLSTPTR